MNKRVLNAAPILFNLRKHDVGDPAKLKIINSLSYDDILDFAELVEDNELPTDEQVDRCDVVLRIEHIEKFTKESIIHYILRDRNFEYTERYRKEAAKRGQILTKST